MPNFNKQKLSIDWIKHYDRENVGLEDTVVICDSVYDVVSLVTERLPVDGGFLLYPREHIEVLDVKDKSDPKELNVGWLITTQSPIEDKPIQTWVVISLTNIRKDPIAQRALKTPEMRVAWLYAIMQFGSIYI